MGKNKPTLGFTDADRLLAQEKARTIEPGALAVIVQICKEPRDRCQIRIPRVEWDEDGTMVEGMDLVASGRTFHDALLMFHNFMAERTEKEKEGEEKQKKLRQLGLA